VQGDRLARTEGDATEQLWHQPVPEPYGLSGIAGTMTILIDAGKHSYQFEYTLGPD